MQSSIDNDTNREPIKHLPRFLLFDLSLGGHHPGYIQHLIEYWGNQKLAGYLDIVVLPQFLKQHRDVVEIALSYCQQNVNIVPISVADEAILGRWSTPAERALRNFREWEILCKYAEQLKATNCLLMYFDTCQLPIIFGRKLPCRFSGIYFRPTLHYQNFEGFTPTLKDTIQQWRETFQLSLILRRRELQNLFCLDPFAIEYIGTHFNGGEKVLPLADPVQVYPNNLSISEELKATLKIDDQRRIFLLFGALTGRKGIYQLLEAVSLLPANLCEQLCLLLVGPIGSGGEEKSKIKAEIATISQSLPVQMIVCDRFIQEPDISPYFAIADVILAPYCRHVGMSAILVRAAVAQKPVLCSNYGLMGEITRRYHLGLTVDSTVPSEIAKGLTQFLLEPPAQFCDRDRMKLFAEQNSAEKFAATIFQHLLEE